MFLIVSHDRWFLDRVATAILAFEGDGVVTLHEGSHCFYAERRAAVARDAPVAAEREVATLEATLSDPAVVKERSTEVPDLVAKLERARMEVERPFARWQELDAIAKY
ncbi:MAG TPA: hypothetical protein VMJ10_30400 [Kofleriaceae bacterium]|nr:hypothetical protein [Kofleriaceae bacterium]